MRRFHGESVPRAGCVPRSARMSEAQRTGFHPRRGRLAAPILFLRSQFRQVTQKGAREVYSVSWQVGSSILTLRRETAREALHVAELQIAGDRVTITIADPTGGAISLHELRKRAEVEASAAYEAPKSSKN
jgi:hypothetical protein